MMQPANRKIYCIQVPTSKLDFARQPPMYKAVLTFTASGMYVGSAYYPERES